MRNGKLKGTVAVVYTRAEDSRRSLALLDPEFTTVGGRGFITGTLHTYPSFWAAGQRYYLPLDDVMSIIEFETLEAHDEALRKYGEEKNSRENEDLPDRERRPDTDNTD